MVKKILDSSGATVETIQPQVMKRTVSQKTAETLRTVSVSRYCRGRRYDRYRKCEHGVEGYKIGGKTGTAEKIPRDKKSYVVSFLGAAPIDNPQVVSVCGGG